MLLRKLFLVREENDDWYVETGIDRSRLFACAEEFDHIFPHVKDQQTCTLEVHDERIEHSIPVKISFNSGLIEACSYSLLLEGRFHHMLMLTMVEKIDELLEEYPGEEFHILVY